MLRAPAQEAVDRALVPHNVLLIVADDLGVANVGAYRQSATAPPTPNLDALAQRGVLFRAAYANPVCSPSRACVQTGRHGFRTGVGYSIIPFHPGTPALPLAEWTLPEVLDAGRSGYAHAAIGKWHLGDPSTGGALAPNLAGWAHYAGLLDGAVSDNYAWPRTVNGTTAISSIYATTQMVDDTLAFVQTAREPWVCVLNLLAPHSPYQAPPALLHTYNLAGLDPRTTPLPFYKAAIQAMDTELGRLFRGLGATLNNTNVLFTSDNGTSGEVAEAPYSRYRVKGTTYEGGIHVPLLAAGPDVLQPGRDETALVSVVDLFSTICELCGVQPARIVPPQTTLDGISFARHLRQANQPWARVSVFSEFFVFRSPGRGGESSLRDARFKLIRTYQQNGPPFDELYDLTLDPLESHELLSQGSLPPGQAAAYLALRTATEQLRASP